MRHLTLCRRRRLPRGARASRPRLGTWPYLGVERGTRRCICVGLRLIQLDDHKLGVQTQ
ncbi:hypothetical protein SETIT_2G204800v2 [Setaria italica]|uniref:Uncharacterized protein n=1 Tax=Setaria italica TaxID=4555 RepID=A0A368Q1E6_SETIT|nr:hypothetical protein SETIT_2G204800v2 [Setaria italica]